jgi:hypothetical protein
MNKTSTVTKISTFLNQPETNFAVGLFSGVAMTVLTLVGSGYTKLNEKPAPAPTATAYSIVLDDLNKAHWELMSNKMERLMACKKKASPDCGDMKDVDESIQQLSDAILTTAHVGCFTARIEGSKTPSLKASTLALSMCGAADQHRASMKMWSTSMPGANPAP